MKIRVFILLLTLFAAVITAEKANARSETIAAIVNSDAISTSDVKDRMQLVIASSGLPDTKEIKNKLMPQVMRSLIEEQIKLQEAGRLEIEVLQEEIDQGFVTVAQQNNLSIKQFKSVLGQNGINPLTMERQIRSQISWSKVVQQELRHKVSVSDSDIDAFIQRIEDNKGKKEYLISEIFLPVEEPKRDNDTRLLANKLRGKINSGKTPFFKIAQQFSKAAGSAQGGDLGWIQQDQLSKELDKALISLKKGTMSQPVRSISGYHILLMRDYRTISDETIPTREQVINILGIQRLERAQKRHFLDLKAAAFIENRVES